ncbi:MAG: hypothetical protein ACRD0J_17040 [Acidimicrobiales bacterium]
MGDLTPEPLDLDMLTASLRADSSDNETFFEVLGAKLSSALGPRVSLERAGGFMRRGGAVRSISVDLGEVTMAASRDKGRITCQARRSVRGIVLRTEELDFDTWLLTLAQALTEEARHSAATRAALQSLLT